MNNITVFEVTSTVDNALKKLAKAQIPVFRLRKEGAKLRFGVNEEYVKKVFAIFAHPCYNVRIRKNGARSRFIAFVKRRAGLFVGAAVFAAAVLFSGNVVFAIDVTGSGSFLGDQVRDIARQCGATEWSLCLGLDKPLLEAKVLALPQVNFCSVQRNGSHLVIDVMTDESVGSPVAGSALKADCQGEIYRLVTICGTPQKSQGDSVSAGDVLIGAYVLTEEGERVNCLAAGFAEIKITAVHTLFFEEDNDENKETALSATALYSDKVLEKTVKSRPSDGGFIYEVEFTYLKTVSVNME